MAKKKAPTAEQVAKARSEAAQRGHATRGRKSWEAQHPERFKDLASALGERMSADESLGVPSGMDKGEWVSRNESFSRSVGPGMTYHLMGWQGHDDDYVHPDQPGLFENPTTLQNPPKWEDYSPKQQEATLKSAAMYGVTPESARRAYSTQLDRAMVREDGRHQSFYSEEGADADGNLSPRSRLVKSAAENGVPLHHQAAANAMTSPQNKFLSVDKESGEVTYPNDTAATHAIQWAKAGKTGDEYLYHKDYYVPREDKIEGPNGRLKKRDDDPRGYPAQGYPANAKKAIDVESRLLEGQTIREAWPQSPGQEKTQPFYNAWVDPKGADGQYLVSDVHTGGEGFAPHLSKDDQAKYLTVRGVKAMHDSIARDVNRERGLVSINRVQSAQWNQAKLEQGHGDVDALTHSKKNDNVGAQFGPLPGQKPLF